MGYRLAMECFTSSVGQRYSWQLLDIQSFKRCQIVQEGGGSTTCLTDVIRHAVKVILTSVNCDIEM